MLASAAYHQPALRFGHLGTPVPRKQGREGARLGNWLQHAAGCPQARCARATTGVRRTQS